MGKKYVRKSMFKDAQGDSDIAWAAGMMRELVDTICRRMRKSGLNQTKVAKILGVSEATVCRFLSAEENSTLHTVVKVARAVGMKHPTITLRDRR